MTFIGKGKAGGEPYDLRAIAFHASSFPWPDQSSCSVYSGFSSVEAGDDMTVLVGSISEGMEVVIASDSRGYTKDGDATDGHFKTWRLNSRCAIGFSGNSILGNQIAAIFMGKADWAWEANEVDLLARIEKERVTCPGLSCADAVRRFGALLKRVARKMLQDAKEMPDVSFVLVGKDGPTAHLARWTPCERQPDLWKKLHGSANAFDQAQILSLGPKGLQEVVERVRDTSSPFLTRIERICTEYSSHFPHQVNTDFTMRLAANSFMRESLKCVETDN